MGEDPRRFELTQNLKALFILASGTRSFSATQKKGFEPTELTNDRKGPFFFLGLEDFFPEFSPGCLNF